METNNSVVFENIAGTDGRYRWTRYLNIRVIEDTTNGYINATKMCAMYGKTKGGQSKEFRKWKYSNEQFIRLVSSSVQKVPDELVPCAVTGGQIEIIRGTYVHRDLAVKLASWCSDEFGYMVSKIINSQIEVENRMLTEEKGSLLRRIDELMKKTDTAVEEITNVRKQNDGLQCTLNKVLDTVTSIENQVVLETEDPRVKELMILMYSAEKDMYVVLRTQERSKKQAIKNCRIRHGNEFEEAFNVISYQNPRNLLHRFKDHINGNPDLKNVVKFHRTTFQTALGIDSIKGILFDLEKTFQEKNRCMLIESVDI